MRRIQLLLIPILLLSSYGLTAQNSSTKRADKQYARFQFVEAAKSYNKLVDKGKGDAYVYKQLADCYYNIFNPVEAERWYAQAIGAMDTADSETIYRYAQMLKANGKYEASNTQMDKFSGMVPSDVRAMAYMANPNYLPKILDGGKKFNIQAMSFNSEQSDFGGTLKDGVFYFSSARNSERKTYGWNEEPFLDIYAAQSNEDGTYQPAVMLGDNINTRYHEDVVSFSPDGQTMYFSRESFYDKDYQKDSLTNTKYSQLYLYKATKSGSGWDNVESLLINSPNYSVKNPSVSADGKVLYFSSNMAGGYGNFDIYKAPINADGTLGTPENLGGKVNTEGQEMFPYISSTNTLYFSSDGHLGLGGMDVFFTKEVDGTLAPVRNIGIPINSNADDFAFSMDETTENGFVSSNRAGGVGSDDIYAIKKIQPLCDVLLSVTVLDAKTNAPLSGALVGLSDTQGNTINTKPSNGEGQSEYVIECDKAMEVSASLEDYESKKVAVEATSEEAKEVTIYLDPIEKIIVADKIVLNPIYFEFDKSNITEQAAFELDKLVAIMEKYPDMVINATSHTDNRGSDRYNEGLSERRAKTTAQYVISKGIDTSRITAKGMGETTPKVDCKTNCTKEEHQQNRRSEFTIVSGGPNQG